MLLGRGVTGFFSAGAGVEAGTGFGVDLLKLLSLDDHPICYYLNDCSVNSLVFASSADCMVGTSAYLVLYSFDSCTGEQETTIAAITIKKYLI
jgi:hypothetical protein